MKIASLATVAAIAVLLTGAAARADSAPALGAPAKGAAQIVHSPKSVECYRQADARQLHHAERRKFYVECVKAK
ncbi:MAG: hypothetical protein ABR970_03805 [Roseiarcus sp.]|jgi:hypothetical protein